MSNSAFLKALANGYVVLDTETTGLGSDAEIVELCILDDKANILLDSRVKPSKPIPAEATAIHGITDTMCEHAPTWAELAPRVRDILQGRVVVVYNVDYDRRLLMQSDAIAGLANDWRGLCAWHCAMDAFAQTYGEKSSRGGYKWKSLKVAADYYEYPFHAHSALSDCMATLHVCRGMLAANA